MTRINDTRLGTVKRPKNRARIVVTLEVEVDMQSAPSWQPDAIDVLRSLMDAGLSPDLNNFRKGLKALGVTVLSEELAVAK